MRIKIRAGDWTTVVTELAQEVTDMWATTDKETGQIQLGFDLGNYTNLSIVLNKKEVGLFLKTIGGELG